MNVYLDFEATQFGGHIIAIGAYCNLGSFKRFVKPPKDDHITPFITQLTGITKEDLENACTPDEAFGDLLFWLSHELFNETYLGHVLFFHAFGDSDSKFLMKTARYIENVYTQEFVINLANSLIDDSKVVREFFHVKGIGLYKALQYFNPSLKEQNHDPVEDAKVLSELMKNIANTAPLTEYPYEDSTEELPGFNIDKNEVILGVSKQHPDSEPKKFYSEGAVISWAYDKVKKNSPNANRTKVKKHIINAIKTNGEYLNRTWEIRLIEEDKNE